MTGQKDITASGCSIVKTITGPDAAAISHLYCKMAELSHDGNVFCVPRLLDFNPQKCTLAFEYLPGYQPLANCLCGFGNSQHLIEQTARSLAWIHQRAKLKSRYVRMAPRHWLGEPEDCVLVHGDFNLINVGYDSLQSKIVILDWETNPAVGGYFNIGSRYLDIASFLRSLLLQQPGRTVAVREFGFFARCFMKTYQDVSRMPISVPKLRQMVSNLHWASIKKQWRQKKWISLGTSLSGSPVLGYFLKHYQSSYS